MGRIEGLELLLVQPADAIHSCRLRLKIEEGSRARTVVVLHQEQGVAVVLRSRWHAAPRRAGQDRKHLPQSPGKYLWSLERDHQTIDSHRRQ